MRRGGQYATATPGQKDSAEKNFITYRPEAYYERNGEYITARDFDEAVKAGPQTRFSVMDNAARKVFYTWQKIGKSTDGWVKLDSVRPEVEKAFVELTAALDASPMNKRAASMDKKAGG